VADYLLDTNILVLALRADRTTLDFPDALRPRQDLYISVITRTEILAGIQPSEEVMTGELLASLISLPVDSSIADEAGKLISHHARPGFQISFPDALITATALLHELTLVTTNTRHFPLPRITPLLFPSFKQLAQQVVESLKVPPHLLRSS